MNYFNNFLLHKVISSDFNTDFTTQILEEVPENSNSIAPLNESDIETKEKLDTSKVNVDKDSQELPLENTENNSKNSENKEIENLEGYGKNIFDLKQRQKDHELDNKTFALHNRIAIPYDSSDESDKSPKFIITANKKRKKNKPKTSKVIKKAGNGLYFRYQD